MIGNQGDPNDRKPAVAANANVAAPIDAAVAANIGSDHAVAEALAPQDRGRDGYEQRDAGGLGHAAGERRRHLGGHPGGDRDGHRDDHAHRDRQPGAVTAERSAKTLRKLC